MEVQRAAERRPSPTGHHDIVVVGASAGGLAALQTLLARLPSDLPAALFAVLHITADSPALLAHLLQRETPLPVSSPDVPQPIQPGHIYVAPPDRHLLLTGGDVHAVRGPKENGHRPAIDPLFRSAAAAYGPRVLGVILTGTLTDGAAGLWAIKSSGGATAVQEPAEAEYADMPAHVLQTMDVDYRLPLLGLAELISRLSGAPLPALRQTREDDQRRLSIMTAMDELDGKLEAPGKLSAFTCPSCGGALWELDDGGVLRYRCHTGHGFSADALRDAQADGVEEALYSALRALKERAALARRMSEQYSRGVPELRSRYEDEVRDLERQADVLRRLLSGQAAA